MGSAGGSDCYLQYHKKLCINLCVMEVAKFNSKSSKKLDSCKAMNVKYRSFGGSHMQQ